MTPPLSILEGLAAMHMQSLLGWGPEFENAHIILDTQLATELSNVQFS